MTQFTGLSEREAALSREKYGSNAIPESEPTTFWAEFKATFQNPMIRILLAVALLMVVMCLFGYADVYEPAGTILAVILVAVVSAKTGEGLDDLLKAIGGVLDNGARRVTIHLPYDKGGILETLYQQAKVESVEYGQTIDVKAVCTTRIIGQLGPLVEGWQPHKEPWED